jgi:serine/threonine-protein kinase ATR
MTPRKLGGLHTVLVMTVFSSLVPHALECSHIHAPLDPLGRTTGLFDKGQELATPERVPFRLTQNMIDAFGVIGVEGGFRRSCELSLSVIRQNRDLLINVLQPFVTDPLVEWDRGASQQLAQLPVNSALYATALQEQGVKHLDKIEKRLRGQVGKDNIPLAVRGHVELLLNEATSASNLSRMYIGWMSWL